jgi:hypothetical protein
MTTQLLEVIRDWKLEAKLEDTHRYFYHISDVQLIENGSRCYVIGRKGTGKTAISEYLNNSNSHNRFTQKLSFKNFPFNELYGLKNDQYNPPNQYITLWKYIIYTSVAKMMSKSEGVDPGLRKRLAQIYSNDPSRSLARTISRWTSGAFSLNIMGSGASIGGSRSIENNNFPLIERVAVLEEIIDKYIDSSSYYVIFDELDEDYKDITAPGKYGEYIALLTGLFKAVQDVKSVFPSRDFHIYPVIFLRDDIFDIMRDTDKTKWSDFVIELEWNTDRIKKLLAFRISRAIDPDGPILDFMSAWNKVFLKREIPYGNERQKHTSSFEYITRSTQIRPRDYIKFMQTCAESAAARESKLIDPETIKRVDKSFSNYLRSEIEDEMHSALPEIRQILDLIAHLRKPQFKLHEFVAIYERAVKSGQIIDKGAETVLKLLFHFSVIGNQPAQRYVQVFRYLNKDARLNLGEEMCVHRGLLKAFQIY